MIDSNAANRVVDDRNVGLFWGTTMRPGNLKLRNLTLMTGLTLCVTMLPAASRAFTQDDQRRLCTGDVFRLCASEIPERGTDHGLLEEAARQFERGLSWGFWQADRPVCFRAVTQARTSPGGQRV